MLLDRLSGLAAERSSQRRVELLREITDLFLGDVEGHSSNEMALFDDVLSRVADEVSQTARAELSERIADAPRAPRGLLLRLATDAIGIARSVLQRSPALTERDLESIARTHSNAHLLAISSRPALTPAVTDVLIERGDRQVVGRVAENDGARFSRLGYSALVGRAAEDEELQMRLAMRRDLDEERIAELIPALSDRVMQALTRQGFSAPDPTSFGLIEKLRARLGESDRELRELMDIAAAIKAGSRDLSDTVMRLARARRSYDLGVLLGDLVGLPKDIVVKNMQRRQNEPILIVCRALSLPWEVVDAVLSMKAAKAGETYRSSQNLRRTYEALSVDAAERAMRLLKVRTAADRGEAA
jgi:uncharacterized protein (DUF2336 family)